MFKFRDLFTEVKLTPPIKDLIYIGAILILIACLVTTCKRNDNAQTIVSIDQSLADSITRYRDKYNHEVAQRRSIEFESSRSSLNYIKNLKTKDNIILRLQGQVKETNNYLIGVDTQTDVSGEVKTSVDTSTVKGTRRVNYNALFTDKWVDLKFMANKDSTRFKISVKNELDIIQEWHRDKFWKPGYSVVKVTQLNPYSTTTNMQAIVVKPKKWPLSISIGLPFAAGAAATYFLLR